MLRLLAFAGLAMTVLGSPARSRRTRRSSPSRMSKSPERQGGAAGAAQSYIAERKDAARRGLRGGAAHRPAEPVRRARRLDRPDGLRTHAAGAAVRT